jgi:hypothetical protein
MGAVLTLAISFRWMDLHETERRNLDLSGKRSVQERNLQLLWALWSVRASETTHLTTQAPEELSFA